VTRSQTKCQPPAIPFSNLPESTLPGRVTTPVDRSSGYLDPARTGRRWTWPTSPPLFTANSSTTRLKTNGSNSKPKLRSFDSPTTGHDIRQPEHVWQRRGRSSAFGFAFIPAVRTASMRLLAHPLLDDSRCFGPAADEQAPRPAASTISTLPGTTSLRLLIDLNKAGSGSQPRMARPRIAQPTRMGTGSLRVHRSASAARTGWLRYRRTF